MEIDIFLSLLKKAKPSLIQTGYTDIKVRLTSNPLERIIFSSDVCNCCKRTTNETKLLVSFKKLQRLTIFQAEMLFMVVVQEKKPRDYADYHKCIAGKEFIENINNLVVTT